MKLSRETISLLKRAVILSLLVSGFVSLNAGSPVAAPCREIYTDYYEDPELTTWCGYKINLCYHIYRYGCRTDYQVTETGPCCDTGNDPGGPLCDCT